MKFFPQTQLAAAVFLGGALVTGNLLRAESTTYAPSPADFTGTDRTVSGPNPTRIGSMAGVGAKPSKADLARMQAEAKAGQPVRSRLSAQDQTFLLHAASAHLVEMELGKMAARESANPRVKALGKRMAADHARSMAELRAVASQHALNMQENGRKPELPKKANFDAAWRATARAYYDRAIALYETQSRASAEPLLKGHARKTLPMLKKYRSAVEAPAAGVASR